ncbi:alkaline phosphatase [Chytriomyces confervae]|uniref:Alkaline phosphatase n=1 Tax=Chytriomyces confervae TaxID=246404 RepID=A0A507FG29_9FUNG|nr:hypothetical protein HDU80_008285 [Chytriomyces hyalinus]TPX75311.1 alkaline phosphatase [Chytriomyces confervae]
MSTSTDPLLPTSAASASREQRSSLDTERDISNYSDFVAGKLGLTTWWTTLTRAGVILGLSLVLGLVVRWVDGHLKDRIPVQVILMVSDGFGPASQTLARNYATHVSQIQTLALDSILVGASRTRSSNSFVTDSAAGATAFSCALKSYNGAIGVAPDQSPCGTVLEAAKLAGYLTGHVSTSRVTHATPASFSSHVIDRGMEDEIAVQQIGNYTLGRMADLILGGGSCHFKPQRDGPSSSCRQDNNDLIAAAQSAYGWNYLDNVNDFRNEALSLPLLGLFTADHMAYEIDRDSAKEPSLTEMAMKALQLLSDNAKKQNRGFFVMIEGSRIDMAAHSNDPASHVREILAYNEAIAAVIDWVDKHPNTVMISVSDHETGGLSVAHQRNGSYPVYEWFPSVLVPVKKSTESLGNMIAAFVEPFNPPVFQQFIHQIITDQLGITDVTADELAFMQTPNRTTSAYTDYMGKMVSDRAGLGWATHGHSAVDVNLYAHGYKSAELRGNHENTDIGAFIERTMGINLKSTTAKLLGGEQKVSSEGDGWWSRVQAAYKLFVEKKGRVNANPTADAFAEIHYHEQSIVTK